MATENAVVLTRDLLSYTILTDKKAIINLLNKNGVSLSENATDSQVSIATLIASSKSSNFKTELIDLLASKTDSAKDTFQNFSGANDMYGFTGVDDLAFTGSDDFWTNAGGDDKPSLNYKPMGLNKPTLAYKPMGLPTKKTTNPNLLVNLDSNKSEVKDSKERGAFWKGIGSFLKENILTKENINQGLQIGITSINNKIQARQNSVQQEALALQQTQDAMQQAIQERNKPNNIWLIVGVVGALGIVGYLIFKKK
jgi:hypothetical protein